ncbi:MAG: bifunctional serine/threonine-protein kinase/formylglycine-generating enzyme family protein [Planctomycetaceae bacterium]
MEITATNGCVRCAVERKHQVPGMVSDRKPRKHLPLVSDGLHKSLTDQQIVQIQAICDRYTRAWKLGQPPSIEAAAAGTASLIRPALLQHLAAIDIRYRVARGVTVDLEKYLTRWPDLDRTALQHALDTAGDSADTSLSAKTQWSGLRESTAPALPCSWAVFLQRLRESRLLSEEEIAAGMISVSSDSSSTAFGEHLVAAKKLTSFQVNALLRSSDDPLILGEYIVQDMVGRGGMGTVYRAVHRRMKRTVAVKVLRRDIAQADLLAKRFLREVEVAAKLCHPNIVTAYDAGEQNGISYLVSEFVEGQNLSELVKEYGPLSLPLAVDVVLQAARALEYAHREGVIHRDIKPSNLLLDDSGNVKLLDVGLARVNSPTASKIDHGADLTTTGMIMGTVDYMSPEQAQNTRLADERSDIYSLGCTLYFLMTGHAPFAKGTAMERLLAHREQPIPSLCHLSPQVPELMDRLLSSLMAKKPADRMASMRELVHQLEILKANGLPDITLPLSVTAADDNEWLQPLAMSIIPAQQPAAVSRGATTEANEATELMPSFNTKESAEETASRSATSRSKSSMAFLPWVLLPGIAAIVVAAVVMRGNQELLNGSQPGSAPSTIAILTDMSEGEVEDYRREWAYALKLEENATVHGVAFTFIPPGEFRYGDDAVAVKLNTGFCLSQSEVTVGQFKVFAEAQRYTTVAEENGAGGWGQDPASPNVKRWIQGPAFFWNNLGAQFVTEQHPATSLAYTDMIAFCEWMSRETGRTIRLPTEQEWEYACRCGRRVRWSFGDDPQHLKEYAWFEATADKDMQPTRSLKPNAWGLYDMHGNEFERCLVPDAEESGYSGVGPIRGGNIFSPAEETTSSFRQMSPLNSPTHGAFRILMELP